MTSYKQWVINEWNLIDVRIVLTFKTTSYKQAIAVLDANNLWKSLNFSCMDKLHHSIWSLVWNAYVTHLMNEKNSMKLNPINIAYT